MYNRRPYLRNVLKSPDPTFATNVLPYRPGWIVTRLHLGRCRWRNSRRLWRGESPRARCLKARVFLESGGIDWRFSGFEWLKVHADPADVKRGRLNELLAVAPDAGRVGGGSGGPPIEKYRPSRQRGRRLR